MHAMQCNEDALTPALEDLEAALFWGRTVGPTWLGCDANAELGEVPDAAAVLGPAGRGPTCARDSRLDLISAASFADRPWDERWTHQHNARGNFTRNCIDYVFVHIAAPGSHPRGRCC